MQTHQSRAIPAPSGPYPHWKQYSSALVIPGPGTRQPGTTPIA